MAKLLSDLVLPAFQGVGYALLTLLIRLHAAWRALAALCTAAAARLAAAAPGLRPLLAALCALPPREHLGSGPRPPTVLGVAIAEDLSGASWPAALEALGRLLAWWVGAWRGGSGAVRALHGRANRGMPVSNA